MPGAIAIVVVLVVVIPVAVLMSGAVAAALLSRLLQSDVDASNTDDDETPNEYLALSRRGTVRT